tara:strand:+ start:1035 stop:1454 length:420 start_codon:yes stop_codon:yes gene_type:complete
MAFKMKGHTLKGPNQRKFEDDSIINSAPRKYETKNGVEGFDDTTLEDGRSESSSFQMKSPMKDYNAPKKYEVFNWGNEPDDPFKQTETDLRDWMMDERGISQRELDSMMGAGDPPYDLNHPDFREWYAKSGRGDKPAPE